MNDLTSDIYDLMDKADLTAAALVNPKQPLSKIINGIRTRLAYDLAKYIKAREKELRDAAS